MPTYLVHGFRWQRKAIRIHVILNDIEDAAPDWIIAPQTSIALLNSFYTAYDFLPAAETSSSPETSPSPSLPQNTGNTSKASSNSATKNGKQNEIEEPHTSNFNDWSLIKFAEQYDINERGTENISQPYAYVGDYIHQFDLSCSVTKEIEAYEQRKNEELLSLSAAASGLNTPTSTGGAGSGSHSPATLSPTGERARFPEEGDAITNLEETGKGIRKMSSRDFRRRKKRIGWLEKLRDQLQKEAEIGWFVVVCEDEERRVDGFALNSRAAATEKKSRKIEVMGTSGEVGDGGDVALEGDMPPTPTSSSHFGGVKRFFRRSSERSLRACGVSSKSK